MLEPQDIKAIGSIVKEEVSAAEERIVGKTAKELVAVEERIITSIGEMMEQNFLPAVEQMMNEKVAPLADKDFVSRQTAVIQGTLIARQRKQHDQITLLVDFLREQKVLTIEQWTQVKEMGVFQTLDDLRSTI